MTHESESWCSCGHHAANHPEVWSIAGDATTRCIALGCDCDDFDPRQTTELGEAWADFRETILQAVLPPLNRFLAWLNGRIAR